MAFDNLRSPVSLYPTGAFVTPLGVYYIKATISCSQFSLPTSRDFQPTHRRNCFANRAVRVSGGIGVPVGPPP